jgi:hypothetical protein
MISSLIRKKNNKQAFLNHYYPHPAKEKREFIAGDRMSLGQCEVFDSHRPEYDK